MRIKTTSDIIIIKVYKLNRINIDMKHIAIKAKEKIIRNFIKISYI